MLGVLFIVHFFSIVSGLPIKEQLVDVWANTHKKGWINIEASNTLESLLHTAGPLWFVSNIIKVS